MTTTREIGRVVCKTYQNTFLNALSKRTKKTHLGSLETILDDPDDGGIIPGDRHRGLIRYGSHTEEFNDKVNVLHRDRQSGGHRGEQERSRVRGSDWDGQNNRSDDQREGRQVANVGTTSGVQCNSKRAKTMTLAEAEAHQQQRHKNVNGIPGPSLPPSQCLR